LRHLELGELHHEIADLLKARGVVAAIPHHPAVVLAHERHLGLAILQPHLGYVGELELREQSGADLRAARAIVRDVLSEERDAGPSEHDERENEEQELLAIHAIDSIAVRGRITRPSPPACACGRSRARARRARRAAERGRY